jgi:hypothetical protein
MHNAATLPKRKPETHRPNFAVRWAVIAILLLIVMIGGKMLRERGQHLQRLKAIQQCNADHARRMANIDLSVLQNSQFQDPEVRAKWRKVGADLTAEVNLSDVQLNAVYKGRVPYLNQKDLAAYSAVLVDEKAFLDTLDRATFVEDKKGTMQILPKEGSDRFGVQYGQFEKDIKALDHVEQELGAAATKERGE